MTADPRVKVAVDTLYASRDAARIARGDADG